MYYTYILYSDSLDKYYVGYTSDINSRLDHHNRAASRYTKRGIPWKLMYYEVYSSKHDAIKREQEIKKMKSRKYIEQLITKQNPFQRNKIKKQQTK